MPTVSFDVTVIDPLVFQCKSTQQVGTNEVLLLYCIYLGGLVASKIPFDNLLPAVLRVKSVAGCEPVAMSTDDNPWSSAAKPDLVSGTNWVEGFPRRPCSWSCFVVLL